MRSDVAQLPRRSSRREILASSAGLLLGAGTLACGGRDRDPGAAHGTERLAPGAGTASADAMPRDDAESLPFRISLAQWSLHREYFGDWVRRREYARFATIADDPDALLQGELDPLGFAAAAARLGFEGIEYVNTFFYSRVKDQAYLRELERRAADAGVRSLLIMCDFLGSTGDPDPEKRRIAIERHHPWVDAAAFLGCHSVRVNAASAGPLEEQQKLVADGLRSLCEYADGRGLNVLVENHGGPSSDGKWLAGVMELVGHPRIGTLPDFGNFQVSAPGVEPVVRYDRYQGVAELLPWAKGLSAKSFAFDADGNETTIDFRRMLMLVHDSGYRGWIDVEFEGPGDSTEGIVATKRLLERLRDELWG